MKDYGYQNVRIPSTYLVLKSIFFLVYLIYFVFKNRL